MKSRGYVEPFRVTDGSRFRMKDFDPGETLGLKAKEEAQRDLEEGIARLSVLQDKLYAQDRWALLLI
ncbi:MAG TPA: polyphosphate kinase 2 family protein, partial [Candidatus Limnocylindria bacterium]|nr:polyphosphate kinase 2 family protein [Candidatus Limnocylindria bacterium]